MKVEAGADARGERRTLTELYVRQMPSAIGLAYLIMGDRHMAEDMAQEAFIRLAGRFGHLRAPEAFDAYLRKTVVNLCLSHLRRRRVESAYLERQRQGAGHGATVMPDVATRDELWSALHQLPNRQRAAVVLRYYEDLPVGEVAAALGCAEATARVHLHRARLALARELQVKEKLARMTGLPYGKTLWQVPTPALVTQRACPRWSCVHADGCTPLPRRAGSPPCLPPGPAE